MRRERKMDMWGPLKKKDKKKLTVGPTESVGRREIFYLFILFSSLLF